MVVSLICNSEIQAMSDDELTYKLAISEMDSSTNSFMNIRKITTELQYRLFKQKPKMNPPQVIDNDTVVEKIGKNGNVTVIVGKRGSGKTALGFAFAEQYHTKNPNRRIYAVAFPEESRSALPQWIDIMDNIEQIPNGSFIIADEAILIWASTKWQSKASKRLADLIEISRHKDLSMIFITLNSACLNINVLRFVNTLIIKQTSILQQDLERAEMRKMFKRISDELSLVIEACKKSGMTEGDLKSLMYIIDDEMEGISSNGLPTFWSDDLSKAYKYFEVGESEKKPDDYEVDEKGNVISDVPPLCASCKCYTETTKESWCMFGYDTPQWECTMHDPKPMNKFLFPPSQRVKAK